jgi:acyl-CoA synthetase (AMP-forming)/AMP-acid ligase II
MSSIELNEHPLGETGAALTVAGAFGATAQRFPDYPFLGVLAETAQAYGIPAGEITYGEAADKIATLSALYAAAGYGPGHRIGLLLENRPDFVLTFVALNAIGVSVVPINPDLRSAELEYMVGHSEMVVAVAIPSRHDDLMNAAAAIGHGLAVVEPGALPPSARRPAEPRPLDSDTEAAVLYTSGTTGQPKGCLLANEYFLACGAWYRGMGGHCSLQEGRERMLTPLPVFHMNALACSLMAMIETGGCLYVLDRFHPRSWWQSVRDSRATCVHYLGVMPAMLMSAAENPDDTRHTVRFGFGAGVPKELHDPFERRFGFPLIEAWAMTETGAGGVLSAHREPRKTGTSCFGRVPPEIEIRIVDETGADVPDGAMGELLVRRAGANPRYGFFRGYLKDDAATDSAWLGGWFHTGDVILRDGDGDLHFCDRKKNVIRRSGENIAAVEVEGVLNKHPAVAVAGVAPVPDPLRGDEVFACITLREPLDPSDREALAEELVRFCLARLAYYKAPGHVAFVDRLPVTSTQKIQRSDLRALAVRLLTDPATIRTTALKTRTA